MFENEFDYVKINKYIYETIDNFLNPVGESITTFDFMDSLKAFRSGYCYVFHLQIKYYYLYLYQFS